MDLFDIYDFKNIKEMRPASELYADMGDESQETPFFRWWRWTPCPDLIQKAGKSGIFVHCGPTLDESVMELPLSIVPQYGSFRYEMNVEPYMFASFERETIHPYFNTITPSPLGAHLNITMEWGLYQGKAYNLMDLFSFFCKLRKHLLIQTVKGNVEVGDLSFSWSTHKQLLRFACKFATYFFEEYESWNLNR